MTMRKVAWRRWAAVSGAALALATLAAAPGLTAESTPRAPGTERAWLGVYTQALTPELLEGMSYKGKGVLVNRVVQDGPADRAGVQKGDVITSFNARAVESPGALADLVGGGKPGQSAALRVVRDGRTQNLTVKLAARSDDEGLESIEPGRHEIRIRELDSDQPLDMDLSLPGMMRWMGRGRLGVRVEALNPDLGSYFNLPNGKGVLVVEVMKDTPAEKAGLKAGDVITRVGERAVVDAEDLVKALGDDEGKVTLGIVRKGAKRTIEAELGKQERVIRIRRGEGPMGLGDDNSVRGGRVPQREIDDLRRQIDELRRQLERLQHD
jgi:C-terminal processing protease CtpA/Prc